MKHFIKRKSKNNCALNAILIEVLRVSAKSGVQPCPTQLPQVGDERERGRCASVVACTAICQLSVCFQYRERTCKMLPNTQWEEHANCNDFNGVAQVGVSAGRGGTIKLVSALEI